MKASEDVHDLSAVLEYRDSFRTLVRLFGSQGESEARDRDLLIADACAIREALERHRLLELAARAARWHSAGEPVIAALMSESHLKATGYWIDLREIEALARSSSNSASAAY